MLPATMKFRNLPPSDNNTANSLSKSLLLSKYVRSLRPGPAREI